MLVGMSILLLRVPLGWMVVRLGVGIVQGRLFACFFLLG